MQNPSDVLMKILMQWPNDKISVETFLKTYSGYLTEEFDRASLVQPIRSKNLKLSQPLVTEGVAKIFVYVPDPFLAVLLKDNENGFRLHIFTFQCTNCFGTGISGSEVCDVCGGSGWGTL
ncbi:MAG: hypothetical protein BroJett018_06060 [Chloroflexota bacterium]|nr:hypothetical protein [Chloroflexota bacterium]NOG63002.1 hypothetical protein [Chloroflexota bacterium]GIK62812.1 MAG: hypothetical protein BroJett018_06060 [Chloroflexota bacterium]